MNTTEIEHTCLLLGLLCYQTAYRDYPPSAPLWPMYFYPPYHPDYYCSAPTLPQPTIAPAFVPAAFVPPEATFPAKNEAPRGDNASSLPGKALIWGTTLAIAALLMSSAVLIFWRTEAWRPERTTELEIELAVQAIPIIQPQLKRSGAPERGSLPLVAPSFGVRDVMSAGPPSPSSITRGERGPALKAIVVNKTSTNDPDERTAG